MSEEPPIDPPRLSSPGAHVSEPLRELFASAKAQLPPDARLEEVLARASTEAKGGSVTSFPLASRVALLLSLAALGAWGIGLMAARPASHAAQAARVTAPPSPPVEAVVSPAPLDLPTAEPARAPAPKGAQPIGAAHPRRPTRSVRPAVDELTLLARAQRELRAEPERALRTVQEMSTHFPRGRFAQEREIIGVEALLRLGRRDDAEARGRALLEGHPHSAYAPRLRGLLDAR